MVSPEGTEKSPDFWTDRLHFPVSALAVSAPLLKLVTGPSTVRPGGQLLGG